MSMRAHRVLVVDDEPRNLALIAAILEGARVDGEPVELTLVTSGQEAIDRFGACAATTPFDLVLLDVMMPDLDGFSVLRGMRSLTPAGGRIPIVLVTALGSREDRIRGLESGADDFLTKPVDAAELRCRVRTFLSLRRTQRALKAHADQLEAAQVARAELTSMIVHDLKNPLAGVAGSLSWLARTFEGHPCDPAMLVEAVEDAREGTRRVLTLIRAIAEVERAETGQLKIAAAPCAIRTFVDGITRIQRRAALARSLTLEVHADDVELEADAELLGRVLENLLENAIRHTPEGGKVRVDARSTGALLELAVSNTGTPISAQARATLFDKYARGERRHDAHLGLGLYFCRLAVQAHGGRIAVESGEDWPTKFVVRVPLHQVRRAASAPFAHG
jgi:signal transduction histidine kinase